MMTTVYPFSVSDSEFTGKRVLVTGGSRGIGAAIVRRFQLSGAFVATTARSVSPEDQGSTLFVKADIGTVSGMQEVINRVEGEWGGIDVLINNVGGTETKPGGFEVLTDEEARRFGRLENRPTRAALSSGSRGRGF
jgi:NAD(P)-dependent dehydrogenase (short-subunit alcohol dehydrogenase family)